MTILMQRGTVQAFLDGAKSGYLMSLILACINPCTCLWTGWMVDPYFAKMYSTPFYGM